MNNRKPLRSVTSLTMSKCSGRALPVGCSKITEKTDFVTSKQFIYASAHLKYTSCAPYISISFVRLVWWPARNRPTANYPKLSTTSNSTARFNTRPVILGRAASFSSYKPSILDSATTATVKSANAARPTSVGNTTPKTISPVKPAAVSV